MPKEVDHEERRRELADAVCRVVAREGLAGVSLRLVADEAGWSIGSLRYYFTTKDDMLAFALRRVGDRIEERLLGACVDPTMVSRLRSLVREMLPLDTTRREEALVWIAFAARSAVDAKLAPLADEVASRMRAAFVGLVEAAVAAGEMPADTDVARESLRLQALVDGLVVELVSTPSRLTPEVALAAVDAHIDLLCVAETVP